MDHARNYLIDKPIWLRAGASLGFVAVALALTEILWLIVDRPLSSPLFLGAIIASAWICGFRAGIFAAVISGFLIDYYFVPPVHNFTFDFDEIARIVVFIAEGTFLSWLINIRRLAIEEIRTTGDKLRALTNRLHELREDERKRIALEIHDELGQVMTGIKMDVRMLLRKVEQNESEMPTAYVTGKLEEMSTHIDTTIRSIRRIATELRPAVLDDFGLIAAIEWQVREFERKTEIKCSLVVTGDDFEFDNETSTAIFRIVQEALTNVTRHANAKNVDIVIDVTDDGFRMKIADDGQGFDTDDSQNTRSLGILGMQERSLLVGGELWITSDPESGTVVEVAISKTNGARSAAA